MQQSLRSTVDNDLEGITPIISHIVMKTRGHLIAKAEGLALTPVGTRAPVLGWVHPKASIPIIDPCTNALSVRAPVMLLDFLQKLLGAGKSFRRIDVAMPPILGRCRIGRKNKGWQEERMPQILRRELLKPNLIHLHHIVETFLKDWPGQVPERFAQPRKVDATIVVEASFDLLPISARRNNDMRKPVAHTICQFPQFRLGESPERV